MFSLQKFFGKDPKFFDLLNNLALEAHRSAKALSSLIEDRSSVIIQHELRDARIKSKQLFEEISEMVVLTFVTALEREDIEALSNALYRVTKPIEKFVERLQISNGLVQSSDFVSQTDVIRQASDTVVELVKQVSKFGNLEQVRKLNARLQAAESEADQIELQLLKNLYTSTPSDPLKILVMRDLYDLLEKTIDRLRDVGNVVMHIALKNS